MFRRYLFAIFSLFIIFSSLTILVNKPVQAASAEIKQPCKLVDGAFNKNSSGEYNINAGRAHGGFTSGKAVDLGANGRQPSPGSSYQRCKDNIALSSVTGEVIFRGTISEKCSLSGMPTAKNTHIKIKRSDGVIVDYLHMDLSASNTIKLNAKVKEGDVIGTISDKGCVTKNFKHIHLNVYSGSTQLNYSQWKFAPTDPSLPPVVACTMNGTACPLYKFYSSTGGRHYFTTSVEERNWLITEFPDEVWKYEGPTFRVMTRVNGVCSNNSSPVYKLYNKSLDRHYFTMSAAERDGLVQNYGWTAEGVAFCVYGSQISGTSPVFKFYSQTSSTHYYTMSTAERDWLINNFPDNVWKYEGVAFYTYGI